MSIRLLARELYRLQQEVDRLRREIEGASPEKRPELEARLRAAESDRDRLRAALEAKKDRSTP
ncbi:MAG: hypothetical protein WHT06_13600 [Desulfobacterales bacterium]